LSEHNMEVSKQICIDDSQIQKKMFTKLMLYVINIIFILFISLFCYFLLTVKNVKIDFNLRTNLTYDEFELY